MVKGIWAYDSLVVSSIAGSGIISFVQAAHTRVPLS